MQTVIVGAAALACPIGMGFMMWFMSKGMRKSGDTGGRERGMDVEALREEHRRLGQQLEQLERGNGASSDRLTKAGP